MIHVSDCILYLRYLPDERDDMVAGKTYAIDVPGHNPFIVQGVIFTTLKSVNWLGQLLQGEMPHAFHCDGTRRLHHGKWVLITLGVTSLEWCQVKRKHVHSFRPLIYLFCRQQETVPAIAMTVAGLREV